MRRVIISVIAGLLMAAAVQAQDDGGLFVADDAAIVSTTDIYGVASQSVVGVLVNGDTENAYGDLQVMVEAYDDDGELIGEGFGYVTNQCGKSVPFTYTLQPEREQRFSAPLEFYVDEPDVATLEFFPQGRPVDPTDDAANPIDGVIPVDSREVARMEWETVETTSDDGETTTETRLLYGVGCYRDVFTAQHWYAYQPDADTTQPITHPRAEEARADALLERMGLASQYVDDDFEVLYNRSYLTFPPNGGNRIVFQTDNNTLVTAQVDGTYRRILDENLFRSTLQGFQWLPDERFMAYYYGAYGDGVTYLVASTAGAYFSTPEHLSTPSVTVPRVFPSLSNVIVSGDFVDGERGYYLTPPAADRYALLFAWDNLPGNNYPAPVYHSHSGLEAEAVLYFALPDEDDAPRLHCYDRRDETLHDLTPLPFELGTEDRAMMALSPDGNTIALGANGVGGGLWLLDLTAFEACGDA